MEDKQQARYRVMIVDDEPIQRAGITHLCQWSDYGIEIVAQASNGQEALEAIETARPHVIITDIVMPVQDGVELTRIVRSRYPDIKIVVLSSYSEFDYVREVFKFGVTDYLLKPKVTAPELVELIQSLCGDVRPQIAEDAPAAMDVSLHLSQWLSSIEDNEQMKAEALGAGAAHFHAPHYRLLAASTSLLLSRTEWTQNGLEQGMSELAAKHLAAYTVSFAFLKQEAVLIVNYDDSQAEEVLADLGRYAMEAREKWTYIAFLQSERFHSLEELRDEHARIAVMLGQLLYFPGWSVVPKERIEAGGRRAELDQSRFAAALRTLHMDEAAAQLKALLADVAQAHSYDEYSLKRLCQNIIYTVLSTLEPLKLPLSELHSSRLKLFKNIDLAFDIRELEDIMSAFMEDVRRLVRRTEQQPAPLLQQIYDYVEANYESDISLAEMAAALHLNYSYLSSYFKQRTQENLTSYINRVRVDKAKLLIHHNESSISEISRQTGFSDHNYFSKVFKKFTGMTPLEYRNQILQ